MKIRRNCLLLFSKLPEAGLVKTRLSVLKDGILTAEDAADLFRCMLLDVVEICMSALGKLDEAEGEPPVAHKGPACAVEAKDTASGGGTKDAYELVVSCSPKENLPKMRDLLAAFGGADHPVRLIADKGASFDEHYNHAFEQVWDMGADCILSMGADMPALTAFDVENGFKALHSIMDSGGKGIVISPDQEMGVSMVGWTRNTDFDHTGVFYNKEGKVVLSAYVEKAEQLGIPAAYLPPVPDVDTMADLMHNITLIQALRYCRECGGSQYAWRTSGKLEELGMGEVRVPPNALLDPRDVIDA